MCGALESSVCSALGLEDMLMIGVDRKAVNKALWGRGHRGQLDQLEARWDAAAVRRSQRRTLYFSFN